ncbi:MAG TPA: hypothetical protein VGA37_13640 [Gemmatimonadales bacterium]
MQYTLRNIPPALDRALRQRARAEGKSLNAVAVSAMARALGFTEEAVTHRALDDLRGSWASDPECEAALEAQDTIDESLWP